MPARLSRSSIIRSIVNPIWTATSAIRPRQVIPAPLPLLPLNMVNQEENEEEGRDDITAMSDLHGGYTPYLGYISFIACLGGLQFGWVSLLPSCQRDSSSM